MTSFESTITSQERVRIDDSATAAIGLHHSRTSALSDLIDNSISANASEVRLRFLESANRVDAIQIIDNGTGMNADELRNAMAFGAKREYNSHDLGHFGLGLKTASLSQAEAFEIYSRSEWGTASGRRMERVVSKDASVGVIGAQDASRKLNDSPGLNLQHGTIVEWRGLRDVVHTEDVDELRAWRNSVHSELRKTLGVTFHRFLNDGRVRISIDSLDTRKNRVLPPTEIDPIDPFAGSISDQGFPKTFTLSLPDGAKSKLEAHIVASHAGSQSFDLFGQPGRDRQGIYIYRRDRLLTPGGSWSGLTLCRRELGAARIRIDIDTDLEHHIVLNPEKISPNLSTDLIYAMKNALAQGNQKSPLSSFFSSAEQFHRALKKPQRAQISLVEPASGISPRIIDLLEQLQDFSPIDPIDIRISTLPADQFFRADRVDRRIELNANHLRSMYENDGRLSNQSAQFVKVCIYFLVEDDFKKEQRWSDIREERHRLLNRVLLEAIFEDSHAQNSTRLE